MVTLIKYGVLSGGVKYNINQMWICGLSTDTPKPTTTIDGMPIPNGSVYTEIDTGKNFMFDYDNTTWYEVSIGGGGGTSGGIVLVGETTTQLSDNATTNPITVDGQSYTAQPNDAVIYGNKEFLFDGTKWHEFGDLSGLSSKDIGAMTNYVKAQTGAAIATTDTLNQAIGKVEKRVDDNENNISSLQDSVNGREFTFTSGGNIATNVDVGATVDITPNPVGSWSYTVSPCNAGEVITINGQGGSTPRLWAFTDKDYKLISKSADGAGMTGGTVTAPTNAAYCIINSTTATLGFCGIYGVKDDISTLQEKVVAHTAGGSNYDTINGIRVYVSSTAPTGDIPTGSIWIGG